MSQISPLPADSAACRELGWIINIEMSLISKDPGYNEPSYIDYYAKELRKDSVIELRYRLFPGFPVLSPTEADTFLTQLAEHSLISLNNRYFAVLDPYVSGELNLITDLEKVVNLGGRLNTLTPRFTKLEGEKHWIFLPPYSPKGAPIGEEIRVTMDFSLENIGNRLDDVGNRVKEAHVELKPFAWLSSPTPGEFECVQLPYRRCFIVLDPKLKENSEKSPSTIGTERLPVVCLALLEGWKEEVDSLRELQFSSWRKSRADGNSYYHSVGVAYLEGCMRVGRTDLLQALLTRIEEQQDYYIWEGLEDHHYYFQYRLRPFLEEFWGSPVLIQDFQALLEDLAFDEALVGVVRNLAAYWMHCNSDIQAVASLAQGRQADEIAHSVLESEKTAGDLAFLAVPSALQVTVNQITACKPGERTLIQVFPPASGQSVLEVNLIVWPGHCDILYKAAEDQQDHYDSFTGQFDQS